MLIMNFLNGCKSRYGSLRFWTTPCCRDNLKSSCFVNYDDDRRREANKPTWDTQLVNICAGKHRKLIGLTLWTQVRFQRECPRLHRDLEFPNFDKYRKDEYKDVRKTYWGSGDGKPGFTYVVGFFGLMCGGYALKTELTHFISFMSAAADVVAMASIEVDISKIAPGACASYKWRGKPLFIKHRTEVDIELEAKTPVASLRDPQSPEDRTIKPEWLVVIGICTHLGCVPIPNSGDWPGGFYCPCHGSHYDNVGRARKGPAPLNLEVPPYKFMSDSLILVG